MDAQGRQGHDPEGTRPHNLCRLQSGAIGLVYWQRDMSREMSGVYNPDGSVADWNQAMFRKSTDEACTFSEPVPIAPAHTPAFPTFLIQLVSGRLLVPSEYAFKQAAQTGRFEMSLCTAFYSDDEGATWIESADAMFVREDGGATLHFVETPCVAETADGRLLCFMRNEMQRLAQSYSVDGGAHWGVTELNSLASSRSEVMLLRLPSPAADLLCIWNQTSAAEIRSGFYRSRLSSAISTDSGRTWEHHRTLVAAAAIGMVAGRVEPTEPPAWLVSSGPVPHDLELIPAEGHSQHRAPRASVVGDTVFVVWWEALYGRKEDAAESERGWVRLRARQRLRAVPLAWFYGQDE